MAFDAVAFAAEDPAAICERAISNGARREGVPETVLHAISLTETGRAKDGRLRPFPWAINREGKGFWFTNRAEALAFAKASLAEGRDSFDVGCFQINFHWHGQNFPTLESMFDPDTGATYAARFLKSLFFQEGSWAAAAGAYHSQLPERAGVYRARFERILAGLSGNTDVAMALATVPSLAEEPTPGEPPRKSRTRLSRGPKIITIPREPTPQPEGKPAEASLILPNRVVSVTLTL